MNAADICAWLASGQDFEEGTALYARVGTSAVYERLFALGATDYSRGVLQRELAALVVTPAPEPPAPRPAPPAGEPGPPELLAGVQQQLKAVRDERSHLHPQLTGKGLTQKGRLGLGARIVALTHQEVALLAQQAHVQAHGCLPVVPGPVPLAEVTDPGELRRLLTNRRALRSKLKNLPARAADLTQVEADITFLLTKLPSRRVRQPLTP